MKAILGAAAIALCSLSTLGAGMPGAVAATVTDTLPGNIYYDPNIDLGGFTSGDLMTGAFGGSTAGVLSVGVNFGYDTGLVPLQTTTITDGVSSGPAAAYGSALTYLTVDIETKTATADIAATNAATSLGTGAIAAVNTNAIYNPEIAGLSTPSDGFLSGNAAIIADDVPTPLFDSSGAYLGDGIVDFFGFTVGGTDTSEFGPVFDSGFGTVELTSIFVLIQGLDGEDLFTTTGLPEDTSTLLDPTTLGNAIIAMTFDIENIGSVAFLGELLTNPPAAPIPLPAGFLLMGTALAAGGGIRRRKVSA